MKEGYKKLITCLVIGSYFLMALQYKILNDKYEERNMYINRLLITNRSIEDSIDEKVQIALEKYLSKVESFEYYFDGIDEENRFVETRFEFKLRDIEKDRKMFLAYNKVGDDVNPMVAEMTNKRVGEYVAQVNLCYDYDYEYRIFELLDDGEYKDISRGSKQIKLSRILEEDRVKISSGIVYDGIKLLYDAKIEVDDKGFEELELKDVNIEVIFEGRVKEIINISEGIRKISARVQAEYIQAIDKGEINYRATIDKFMDKKDYKFVLGEDFYYYYRLPMSYDDYYEKYGIERSDMKKFVFRIRAKFRDGYEYVEEFGGGEDYE